MERMSTVESSTTPEKSKSELYFDTLKAKRDVLSSHYTLGQLRRGRKVEQLSDTDIEDYKAVKKEYDKRRELFLASFGNLDEGDCQKVAELTSLTKVEIELSKSGKPAEAEIAPPSILESESVPLGEDQSTETPTEEPAGASEVVSPVEAESPDRGTTMDEVDRMLKYSQDTARPLETAYWESKKAELLEREEVESNPDRPAPRGFKQRARDAFEKAKDAFMGANRISGGSESVESRMSPLGLRHEPITSVPNESVEVTQPEVVQPEPAQPETTQTEVVPQEAEKEPKKASGWGWLKERARGASYFGLWAFGTREFHQAEMFRSKTKEAANDTKALATVIQQERNLSLEEAETEAWETVEELKKNNLDIYAPEFYQANRDITERKNKENDEEIEYIVASTSNDLLDKLAKYRGEAGQDVLTQENKLAFQADLRGELNKMRDGAMRKDFINLAKLMRRNLDENWHWRYVWGAAEAVLGFAGVGFITAKIEAAAAAKLLAAEKAAGVVKGGAGAIEQVLTQKMHENVWTTLKEMAQNGPQHLNLDNSTLQELSQKVLDTNNLYEQEWVNQVAEGLRSSRVLPEGMPIKIPVEVLKVLGF